MSSEWSMYDDSFSSSSWNEITATFQASIRSIGTACTLVCVGIYLHRRHFLKSDGKRTLALISQQVTIPLLFFTKIVYCNQDWSTDPCPDVTEFIRDVSVLLVWPLYVVGLGLFVGYMVARMARTPPSQIPIVMAMVGFANSTGLPITLLTVVHTNFPQTSDLGRVDPCLFLSIYLLLYPVLQWGIGGYLLQTTTSSISSGMTDDDDDDDETKKEEEENYSNNNNMMKKKKEETKPLFRRHSMGETDASMYMSIQSSLNTLTQQQQQQQSSLPPSSTNNNNNGTPFGSNASMTTTSSIGMNLSRENSILPMEQQHQEEEEEKLAIIDYSLSTTIQKDEEASLLLLIPNNDPTERINNTSSSSTTTTKRLSSTIFQKLQQFWLTQKKMIRIIIKRCFLQPPVIGALLGILVASLPKLRGIMVDIDDRNGSAPLQFVFDGLYHVGQAAVPINMMILGCNLSASYRNHQQQQQQEETNNKTTTTTSTTLLFSPSTTIAIIIGKLLLMPLLGFLSVTFLRDYVWTPNNTIPDDINGSFYLVVLIVFVTPTANNVMVMMELNTTTSTNNEKSRTTTRMKEGLARCIAWQYAVAPILLSFTMTVAVGMADRWS